MKRKLMPLCGILLYTWYVIRYLSNYKGRNKFYKVAQQDNNTFAKKIAISLLQSPIANLFLDYQYMMNNLNRDRLSNLIIEQYINVTTGSGYYDIGYNKGGGDTLEKQQRGLILPILIKAIEDGSINNNKILKIIEIGTGNGDILADLSAKFPVHQFIGIEFNITNAELKYGTISNISFKGAYALDLLVNGQLNGDIVFASSTFCVFCPKELKRYFEQFKIAGFAQIILNEPSWGGYIQTDGSNNEPSISKHMEGAVWYHNYCSYLRDAGYTIKDFSFYACCVSSD